MRPWQQLKNVYHFFQAHWWRVYFGRPNEGVKIYGITGTNGKTTTCYVLAGILREAYGKDKVGMLSTVGIWLGKKEEINKTKMTTTDSKVVYRYLKEMRKNGVEYVVLEVTSHALDQNRLAGLHLDGAIILNIEREHLDYHGSMEKYAAAKGKIVGYLRRGAALVVDRRISKSKFQMSNKIQNPESKNELHIVSFTAAEAREVSTPLPGDFNKENVLAASKLAEVVGVERDAVRRGVAAVKNVPGRMEWVEPQFSIFNFQFSKELPKVLLDYAVTPGALDRLYKYVREETSGRVLAILGAAGLRDRGKRPLMAKAVARYADEIVLTREDPWTEDEEQIFKDLEQGLKDGATPYKKIIDRREAIKYALEKAGAGDIVVVTGKGAETGMGVGKKIVPWDDRKTILELLKKL